MNQRFQILQPASNEEMSEYESKLNIFGDLKDLRRNVQLNDYETFKNFLDKHSAARTYSFIYSNVLTQCVYHKPLRGKSIEKFGEPVPIVEEGST